MAAPPPWLSVVIASRNEQGSLPALLAQLGGAPDLVREVLVVDGGSDDGSGQLARLGGAWLLRSGPGRGHQLGLGAREARGPWLLLLHADVRLPPDWAERIRNARERAGTAWYFRLAIAGGHPGLRLVELGVALRSRWRQLPYGDQGLLLPLALYRACGGLRPLPLMEDLDLVQRLRRLGRLRSLGSAVRVDGRRWRQRGILRTTLENAHLRRQWRRGADAATLARRYYAGP
ncbi:TIGR04283 family arsenosugar biosynthesis glycosyltransferase [Cyanobium sp. NIES-981]|uniref:TIGR04283 family arsenosugar biosynthesis glycosyltransferase n=1 Tax=Cyanobium sp. NIES-981 TaxID=1851505 RepID=UPI0007DD7313|nr:TIGR04283 family arsenosugar biosynthesis glycosyltransferase [Cyanobium sp. NIES-981]SBO42596.1 Glycosyl transferase, group 2 family protein [Cyanobium sp. NIES-981]